MSTIGYIFVTILATRYVIGNPVGANDSDVSDDNSGSALTRIMGALTFHVLCNVFSLVIALAAGWALAFVPVFLICGGIPIGMAWLFTMFDWW